jgi:hypothetical protein
LVANDELRGRESRAKPELEGRKSKPELEGRNFWERTMYRDAQVPWWVP